MRFFLVSIACTVKGGIKNRNNGDTLETDNPTLTSNATNGKKIYRKQTKFDPLENAELAAKENNSNTHTLVFLYLFNPMELAGYGSKWEGIGCRTSSER
ncbi:hypothetical protein Hanom_Chr13g01229021 [Helianthus anomalus]